MAELPFGVLDPTSDRAVFRQIADQLRDVIRRGIFPKGDKVPSEAQLMEHYGVTRMTVRQSIQGRGPGGRRARLRRLR
ncbi:GntR family transcriptional regulator [Actinoallomurus sp. NPDC052308]|uniref:GntR family transcriptional regulator n=1 Tax=Actinoallomurus sp. NPDC052308 TaxID=3155530 RepID=UPI003427AB61